MHRTVVRFFSFILAASLASSSAFAVTHAKIKKKPKTAQSAGLLRRVVRSHPAAGRALVASSHQPVSHLAKLRAGRRHFIYNPWSEPTFADSTAGDHVDGEDLIVRRAAVQALGPYNGSVVAVDPQTGRVLAMVNQNLAYKSGFQPCSTIKLVAALAGLNEGLIDRNTLLRVGRRTSMDLTEAIAHSNNTFFATVGSRLGFEKVSQYARQFGLGEKACFEDSAEQSGSLPNQAPAEGGVGMMTSFGSGITLTPLQLAALVTAMANGGTLFYLQHPRTQDDLAHFEPKVKRQLPIAQLIPEVKPGMEGAVEYGTARRANYSANEPIFGKTGTCSDQRFPGIHLGWFGSFNEVGTHKIVVTVLLTGGKPINGPVASGVAGAVYRNLSDQGYFGPGQVAMSQPIAITSN